MRAYLTSIGEKTTNICKEQLERFGYEVILLDKKEKWIDKYKRFIEMASKEDEDCLRIDADIIPNKHIKTIIRKEEYLVQQFQRYDLYRNEIWTGGPLLYSKEALQIINDKINEIPEYRPECSTLRWKEFKDKIEIFDDIVGIHGFFQSMKEIENAYQNKMKRGQLYDYDFQLVYKLINIEL